MSVAKRGNTPYWTFGQGGFTRIHDDLKKSKAYRCLRPVEKLILVDMIRVYSKASHSGAKTIVDGFPYTFSMCEENVCETSFQRSIRTLLSKGFFSAPPSIQDDRPASPKRYRQSHDWDGYEPNSDEQRKLVQYNIGKENRLRAKEKRVTDHRAGLKTK